MADGRDGELGEEAGVCGPERFHDSVAALRIAFGDSAQFAKGPRGERFCHVVHLVYDE